MATICRATGAPRTPLLATRRRSSRRAATPASASAKPPSRLVSSSSDSVDAASGAEAQLPRRRDALLAAAGVFLAAPSSAPFARAADAAAPAKFVKDPSFYARWSYAQPSDIIPYVRAVAREGDAEGVLAAMDVFGEYYPMYKLGDEKGRILARLVRERAPRRSVEVGTFLGYSAIWTATNSPPDAKLVCVEFEPRHVEVARALTAYAGVGDKVEILQGAGAERVPDVVERLGAGNAADMVFFDHCKECYLPDLKRFEAAGLIQPGTVVVADNVVYPGAPDFLDYVDTARGAYVTELLDAPFEYDQVWKKDWVPQKDALSFSTRKG